MGGEDLGLVHGDVARTRRVRHRAGPPVGGYRQGRPERNGTEPVHGGDGFIAYYQGYALLEMPRPDSLRLVTLLAATPNFGPRVTRRWQPGSWRMAVPVVCLGETARPDTDALLHFPKQWIRALNALQSKPDITTQCSSLRVRGCSGG